MTELPRGWGARLRRERERRKWTRKRLAEQIGSGASSVYRWEEEGDAPRPEMLQNLVNVLGKPVDAWGQSVRMMPHLRNLHFVGREDLLKRMHSILSRRDAATLGQGCAISGLGGIGKTQTAIEYVYRYGEEYDLVLWALADSRAMLVEQLAELTPHLAVAPQGETDQNRLAKAVKHWLETQRELIWLLIFDNVEDLQVAHEFLPTRGNGAALLTTRLHDVGPHIHRIRLDPLTLEEGVQFFQTRLSAVNEQEQPAISTTERQAAEELWTLLGGLPLALDQAAAFVQETGYSLSEYCTLYHQARGTLLHRRGLQATDHLDSVAVTFEVAWKKVNQLSPASAALLRLSAFLAPAAIPEELLWAATDALPSPLHDTLEQPVGWKETIGILRHYSLLEREGATKSLSVHRLVQAALREELDQETQRRWAERVVRLVNAAYPQVGPETWPQCERLLPQAMQVIEWVTQYQLYSDEADRLALETGQYLAYRGRSAEAESHYRRTLQAREQVWGGEHPLVAAVLVKLAGAAIDQGKFIEAETHCQRAFTIWEHQEGEGEPQQVSQALNILAISYTSRGMWAEAEPLYLQALALCEQYVGPSHDDTARALNNLGNVYAFEGRYLEAEPLYRRALDIWESLLGSENARLAYPLHGLGALSHYLGRYTEAESIYQRALSIRERELGPDHLEMTYLLTGLANLYQEQHRHADAEQLYQRALCIWEEQAGSEHPESAWTLSGLARLYARLGKHDKAKELYQRVLRIWEEQMGPQHLLTIETMRALAELEESRSAHEEARGSYEQAQTMREQALRVLHSQTAEPYRRLIAVLRAIGDYEEAARLERTLSESSPMFARKQRSH